MQNKKKNSDVKYIFHFLSVKYANLTLTGFDFILVLLCFIRSFHAREKKAFFNAQL